MESKKIKILDVEIDSNEFIDLLSDLQKSSSEVFKSIGKEFREIISSSCSVVTDQMAETIKENLGDEISEVNSSLQEACTAVYEIFQDPLRNAVQGAAAIIDEVTHNVTVGDLGESLANAANGLNTLVFAASELVADNLLPVAVDGISWLATHATALLEAAVPLTASVVSFNAAIKGFTIWQTAATTIQTLKTANEGATIAQIALNTAMEANPVGLVVSSIAALTTGLITFAATSSEVTSKTAEYSKALERASESGDSMIAASDKEIALIKHKAERYEELRQKHEELRQKYEDLTDGEMAEFLDLASDLAEVLPEGTSIIDEQTGAYNNLETAIDGVIKKMETQALLNAKYGEYETAVANKYDIEKKLKTVEEEWITRDDGEDIIGTWIGLASGKYELNVGSGNKNDPIAYEAAKKAFIIESLRQEYGIDYFEIDKILAENQEVIDEYYEILNQQYEDLAAADNANISDGDNIFNKLYGFINRSVNNAEEIGERMKASYEATAERAKAEKEATEKVAQDQIRATEEAAEAQKRAMQDKWDSISKQERLGLISSEKAYEEQLKLIQEYCPEYADEWYSCYQEITEYQRDALREQVQGVKDGLSDIVNRYQTEFGKIESSMNGYKNKLLSVGSVFTIDTQTDDEGNVTQTTYSVENLTEQMNKMQKYHDLIKNLKERGLSAEVLGELTNLEMDDGMMFAENLAGSSDEELERITDLYAAKEKLADDLASELYAPEMDKLNSELIADITDQFGTLPAEIREIGGQSLSAFIEGILGDKENLTEAAQEFMDSFFAACDEGISSGSIGMANVGENIAAALGEQDTYAIGYEKGGDLVEGLKDGIGVSDVLSDYIGQLMSVQAGTSAELAAGRTPSADYSSSSWSGSSAGRSEKIVLENHENITVKLDKEVVGKAVRQSTREYQRRTGT